MSPRTRLHTKLAVFATVVAFLVACAVVNFTFTLDSDTLTVALGFDGTATVTLVREGNFEGPVTVTLDAVDPAEAGITMADVTIAGTVDTGDLTIAVADTVAAGDYTLTIKAEGSTSATADLTLTVVEPASVRVLHGVGDAPVPVDVTVDGVEVLADFAFKDASPYLLLPPGDHDVVVTLTAPPTPIITETLTLTAGTSYTVVAIGTAAAGDSFDLEMLVFEDDTAPGASLFRLRAVHASPAAEGASPAPDGVDVYVSEFGDPLPALPAASFVYMDVVDVPEGAPTALPVDSYQVRAAAGGTTTVVYDSGELDLATLGVGGKALVAVAVDGDAPALVTLLVLTGDDLAPVLEVPTVP